MKTNSKKRNKCSVLSKMDILRKRRLIGAYSEGGGLTEKSIKERVRESLLKKYGK